MLVVDIEKRIGDFTLKVCFKTVDGLLSLLGSSGSGKSMTLKCIAGLEKPDKGIIILNNRALFDSEKKINLTPQERRVGYMFQQYALFPNMSVGQNIEAALHYLPKKQRNDVVREKLFEFNLQELESKKPAELSGGEQQRTALARIMASNPEILLLDEPFSALDNYLKWQLLVEMKEQISRFDKDVIFVTHNVDEVVALSENICVLNNGKSEPVMKASDALTEPKTVSTAKLFGCKNFSRLQLKSSCLENDVFTCIDWGIDLKIHSDVGIESKKLVAGVFSQNIELDYTDIETNDYIPCTVSQVIKIEGGTNVTLKIDGKDNYLSATLPLGINVETKKPVRAHIAAEKVLILEE